MFDFDFDFDNIIANTLPPEEEYEKKKECIEKNVPKNISIKELEDIFVNTLCEDMLEAQKKSITRKVFRQIGEAWYLFLSDLRFLIGHIRYIN